MNELKYDLRVYILISSYDPLRIYIFEDGLVRFATKKYDLKSKDESRYMHLTNYSVNKKNKVYLKNKDDKENSNKQSSKWGFE